MRTVALYEMLFGVVTLVGGIIGYLAAGSWISLVAGLVAGLILITAALSLQKGSRSALWVEMIVSLALLGQFGRQYFTGDTPPFFPAGVMSILAVLSVLLLVLILVQPKERKRIF
jgi:uncharacterized membrane protein (UPF0136 family)